MFLLDTNVISEIRKGMRGVALVRDWAKAQAGDAQFLSTVTIFELQVGVLSKARRDPGQAAILGAWLHGQILPGFADRILPIDVAVALRCAELQTVRTRPDRDAFIAATALVHGLTVVTRNVRDFHATGVDIINPWEPAGAA